MIASAENWRRREACEGSLSGVLYTLIPGGYNIPLKSRVLNAPLEKRAPLVFSGEVSFTEGCPTLYRNAIHPIIYIFIENGRGLFR